MKKKKTQKPRGESRRSLKTGLVSNLIIKRGRATREKEEGSGSGGRGEQKEKRSKPGKEKKEGEMGEVGEAFPTRG